MDSLAIERIWFVSNLETKITFIPKLAIGVHWVGGYVFITLTPNKLNISATNSSTIHALGYLEIQFL